MGCRVQSEGPNELLGNLGVSPILAMALEYLGDFVAGLGWPWIHGLLGLGFEFQGGMLNGQTAEWGSVFAYAYPPKMVFQMSATVV
jgi:hypothetical protein